MAGDSPDPPWLDASIPMGVVSMEGRFVRVNQALARVLGRDKDDLMKVGPLAVTHPADRDRLVAMLGLMRAGSMAHAKFRQRLLAAGGEPVDALVSGSVVYAGDGAPTAFAFMVETASPAGRQTEWDSLFAHTRQGIAVIGPDGRHARVNHAYAAILGYAPSDLQGVPWRDTVPADCIAELERAHAEMLRRGSAWLEVLAVRRDGSCFEAEIELVVSDDADRTPSGHLCLLRDTGARKDAELRRSELLRLSSLALQGAGLDALIEDAVRTVGGVLQAEVTADEDGGVPVLHARPGQARELGSDELVFLQTVSSLLGDVARAERAGQRIRQARHDGATGLPDATLFVERLEQALAGRAEPLLTVLVLGVDPEWREMDWGARSSQADMRGAIAERVQACLGPDDFLARLGDRSFGILVATHDELAVAARARCLLKATSRPFITAGEEHTVHATLGVAAANRGDDPRELIDAADRARRRARELGRDRFEFSEFSDELPESPVHDLSDDIRGALSREELRLRYQPIFDLSDRSIRGVEVLLRWEHPSRTVLPLEVFLPAARRTGAIVPIGQWVLDQSLRQLARWNEELEREEPLRLFVNLSARELADESVVNVVAAAIERTQTDPEQLAVEVSDPILIDVGGAMWRSVIGLRELGAAVVLDQFGTALSSLSQLERFPIDMVKLDRSCVAGVADNGRDRAVVKAVVDVAEASGLTAIACGVESERQARALAVLGCHGAQGFLFAEPRAARAVTKLLRWRDQRADREAS